MTTTMMMMRPEEYMRLPYARILTPDSDGGFAAEILEFPGCFAQGETADEAIANLERAAMAWVAASLEEGRDIPPPTDDEGYSGRIALRLPRTLHRRVARQALREGTSINQVLVSAIAAWVATDDAYSRLAAHTATMLRTQGAFLRYLKGASNAGTTIPKTMVITLFRKLPSTLTDTTSDATMVTAAPPKIDSTLTEVRR